MVYFDSVPHIHHPAARKIRIAGALKASESALMDKCDDTFQKFASSSHQQKKVSAGRNMHTEMSSSQVDRPVLMRLF